MENDAPRLGPNHGRDVRKDRTGCAEVGPRERSPRPGQGEVKAEPGTAVVRGRSRRFVLQCPPSGSPPAWERSAYERILRGQIVETRDAPRPGGARGAGRRLAGAGGPG